MGGRGREGKLEWGEVEAIAAADGWRGASSVSPVGRRGGRQTEEKKRKEQWREVKGVESLPGEVLPTCQQSSHQPPPRFPPPELSPRPVSSARSITPQLENKNEDQPATWCHSRCHAPYTRITAGQAEV
ncbi:unnamed protein product [Pleuronectes platessa]|uniref:Uncharacterized protein n=1 Tax=Pleuronectes platessa TaxID=8262 RepID=A0A9N7ULT9_PLEPL|nr:unnamed protein product [Pleuronectes platessa]